MNYLKIEKKYRNNCLKASQAEGREFESRLPLNHLRSKTVGDFFVWSNISQTFHHKHRKSTTPIHNLHLIISSSKQDVSITKL